MRLVNQRYTRLARTIAAVYPLIAETVLYGVTTRESLGVGALRGGSAVCGFVCGFCAADWDCEDVVRVVEFDEFG